MQPESSRLETGGKRRWYAAYGILVLAIAIQAYRILTVAAEGHGETPFLSANDRSRWCTIAALIEDRSFIIDRFLEMRDSKRKSRTWYSIDMVRKPEPDGTEHYYSSKPPFLSVLYAAVCSPLTVLLNHRLTDAPLLVGRALLLIVNLVPLALLWWAFLRWIEQRTADPWSRWILLAMVLFGTFLSTFANTLTNHFPAAFCMMASLWSLECLMSRVGDAKSFVLGGSSVGTLLVTGCFAALTAAFELPALAWFFMVIGVLWVRIGMSAALIATLGGIPIAIAFAVTNYVAYGDLQPPYAHRELLGERLAVAKVDLASEGRSAPTVDDFQAMVRGGQLPIAEPLSIRSARRAETWELSGRHPERPDLATRLAVVSTPQGWSIHRWNDWYDYPRSYWLPENKRGVDLGEPSRWRYAFHVLIGHHGIFSLTPFWFVSAIGAVAMLTRRTPSVSWWPAMAVTVVSLVCIGFYLTRPLIDRNYGGVCSGFRWYFWLIPSWIWLSAWGLESLRHSRVARWLVTGSVAVSILSSFYAWYNPWQHPWLYAWIQAN